MIWTKCQVRPKSLLNFVLLLFSISNADFIESSCITCYIQSYLWATESDYLTCDMNMTSPEMMWYIHKIFITKWNFMTWDNVSLITKKSKYLYTPTNFAKSTLINSELILAKRQTKTNTQNIKKRDWKHAWKKKKDMKSLPLVPHCSTKGRERLLRQK